MGSKTALLRLFIGSVLLVRAVAGGGALAQVLVTERGTEQGQIEPASVESPSPQAETIAASAMSPSELATASVEPASAALAMGPASIPAAREASVTRSRTSQQSRHRVLGLQLDAGVPNGATAALLYRPVKFLRLGGGVLYNYVGYGATGSVSILPYHWIAPSLTFEAGHYFPANASEKIARFVTVDPNLTPMLQRVGYTFANAQLGLELGAPNSFVFFVRGGLSRVWFSAHDANKVVLHGSDGSSVTFADPSGRFGLPSAKLGFMLFFY